MGNNNQPGKDGESFELNLSKDMWQSNPENASKGLYKIMKENYQVVEYPSNQLTIADLTEAWENARKQDQQRRERMNETHTPIEQITLEELDEEIEKWGGIDNVPKGLIVNIRIAGTYQQWPILIVRRFLIALKEEAKKMYDAQKKDNTQQ